MNILAIEDQRFAAGLFWLDRGGVLASAANARKFGRPWIVHWGGQTGHAAAEESAGGETPDGLPALAPALLRHIKEDSWMALVADDAAARYALVKARDGAILADGDEVFADRGSALAAFERARPVGWSLYATPGLVEGAVEIDAAAFAVEPEMVLKPALLARFTAGKVAAAAMVAVGLFGAGLGWTYWDVIERLVVGPPAPVVAVAPEPRVSAAVDSVVLIEACRRVLRERPPYLAAWEIEWLSCAARFADGLLTAERPEVTGHAVLAVRWRLKAGHAEPLHRQIAERHLSDWYWAQVRGGRAWGMLLLGPVLTTETLPAPPFLAFRRAVDRRFGVDGANVKYARAQEGTWTVRIQSRGALGPIAAAAAEIGGLEIVELVRTEEGGWRLEGRPVAPLSMLETRFEELMEGPNEAL